MTPRCINLDWLEVFCLEPDPHQPLDANYYRAQGFFVEERDYGTRIYHEMFTVLIDGQPFIEVRRRPKTPSCYPQHATYACIIEHATYPTLPTSWQTGLKFIDTSFRE